MKAINSLVILFIFFILPSLSFALTYDELVDSYSYDYTENTVNITNVSLNSCSGCNNLTITLHISLEEAGTYEISGVFQNQADSITNYFFGEPTTASLTFYPPFQYNESALWVSVTRDDELLYFANASSINIEGMDFEQGEIYVISESEKDGKLEIGLSVKMPNAGDYTVSAYLFGGDETFIQSQTENINLNKNITIVFDPQIDANFTLLKVDINQSSFILNYPTLNYSFAKLRFLNDTISDGNLIVNVNNTNNEEFGYYLYDSYSDYITFANTSEDIVVFNGSKINSSGLNGPYIIKAITSKRQYVYTTGYYNYSSFQKIVLDEDNTIIGTLKTGAKKIGGFIGGAMGFFTGKEENITITDETKNNSDERGKVDAKNIGVEPKTPQKNSESFENAELKNSFFQNLITGNFVLDKSSEISFSKEYKFWAILTLLIIISSIVAITLFIRLKKI